MIKIISLEMLLVGWLLSTPPAFAANDAAAPNSGSAVVATSSISSHDDAIGNLIRDIKEKQEVAAAPVMARAQLPAPSLAPQESTAALMGNDNAQLAATYENMARCLARAALATHPEVFRQGRPNAEEFLKGALIQSSYETGRFSSDLAKEACNYWGMKDRGDIGGEGKIFYKGEYYSSFHSMYDGCLGYMTALKRDRYAGFVQAIADKKAYIQYITRNGWCPKETYADEAMALYGQDQALIDHAVSVASNELYSPSMVANQ